MTKATARQAEVLRATLPKRSNTPSSARAAIEGAGMFSRILRGRLGLVAMALCGLGVAGLVRAARRARRARTF